MRIFAIGPWEFHMSRWTGDKRLFWRNSSKWHPSFREVCLFGIILYWGRDGT
jgi:hypothetical protein